MEKEQKARNETSKQNEENQTQNKEQQSFLGEASFSKEGSVGSNPTPPAKALLKCVFCECFYSYKD